MAMSGQRHAPAASPLGIRPIIHCTGEYDDPRDGQEGYCKSRRHQDWIP